MATLDIKLRKGKVRMDCFEEKTFECYLEDGDWNGWACPWFTEEVADEICKEINSDLTSHLKIDKDRGTILYPHELLYAEYDFAGRPDGACEYKVETINVDGKEMELIPLGNCVWIWDEVEE